ncbi:hypothetical protein THIOSC13_160106 [uncultured Thiomicrorhabdus sp.]
MLNYHLLLFSNLLGSVENSYLILLSLKNSTIKALSQLIPSGVEFFV